MWLVTSHVQKTIMKGRSKVIIHCNISSPFLLLDALTLNRSTWTSSSGTILLPSLIIAPSPLLDPSVHTAGISVFRPHLYMILYVISDFTFWKTFKHHMGFLYLKFKFTSKFTYKLWLNTEIPSVTWPQQGGA